MSDRQMPQNRHKTGFRGPSPAVGKATQFKAGEPSANPGGRPRKRPVTSALERLLDDSTADGIAKALIEQATGSGKGSVIAAREIMDRLGKVSMPLEAKFDIGANMTDEELQAEIDRIVHELGYVKKG